MRIFLLLFFILVVADCCKHCKYCKKSCDIDQLNRSFDVVHPPGKEGDTYIDYEFRKNFKLAEKCGIVSTCKYFIAYQFADGAYSTQYLKEKQEDLLPVSFLNGTWMLTTEAAPREITGLKCFSSGTQRCEDFVNPDYNCWWAGCEDALNITTEWSETGWRRVVYTCPENTSAAWVLSDTGTAYVGKTPHYYAREYCPPTSIWKRLFLFCLDRKEYYG